MPSEVIIDEIISVFMDAGFMTEAERLKKFKDGLESESPEIRSKSALEVIGFCHPKAWGDLAVVGKTKKIKTIADWDAALSKLCKYAKKRK